VEEEEEEKRDECFFYRCSLYDIVLNGKNIGWFNYTYAQGNTYGGSRTYPCYTY
jgi:hypothetical protein